MGDGDEGACRGGCGGCEVVGQPGDALDVEVVGRLVEQEHVGVGDEQPGQGQPAALAAGQRPDDRVEPARPRGVDAAEQPGEHVADAGVTGPHVLGEVTDDRLAHGPGRVERVDLAEQADGDPAGAGDPAGVDRLLAREHPQQGRLAATVAPDDADALARCRRRSRARRGRWWCRRRAVARSRGRGWPWCGPRRGAQPRAEGPGTTWAPWTGPLARRTSPRHPGGGERDAEVERRLGRVGEERHGRARPRDDAADRAVLEAGVEHLAAGRAGARRRRRCRSLVRARAEGLGSPERSAVIIPDEGSGSGTAEAPRSRSHSAYTAGVDSPASLTARTQW